MNLSRELGAKMRAGKTLWLMFLPPFFCLLFLLFVTSSFAIATERQPNFVVIFADDLGYGDISCYSPPGVDTPHLNALAAEGFRSTDNRRLHSI